MINSEHCPTCKGSKVRRGSNIVKHYWRRLNGSQLRYCRECGERWHIFGARNSLRKLLLNRYSLVLVLTVLIGLKVITFAVSRDSSSLDPLQPVKYLLAQVYDKIYGEAAPKKLWGHWDSVFDSEQEAIQAVRELSVDIEAYWGPRATGRKNPKNKVTYQ